MRLWLVIVSLIVLFAVEGLGFPDGDEGLDTGELEVHTIVETDLEETIAVQDFTRKNGAYQFFSNLARHDAIRGKSCPRKSKCNNGVKGKCKVRCIGKMEDTEEGCSKRGAAVQCKCCVKKCKPKKKCRNTENLQGTCSRNGCKPGEKEIAKGCKGKGCSCCVEDVSVPSGFENFNGRIIRRTIASDTRSNTHNISMTFCDQFGAKPFIPITVADHELYREVRESLTVLGHMWLPADDLLEEGTLRWFNGQVASHLERWNWAEDTVMYLNNYLEDYDCLIYGTHSGGLIVVTMFRCITAAFTAYPPICEII